MQLCAVWRLWFAAFKNKKQGSRASQHMDYSKWEVAVNVNGKEVFQGQFEIGQNRSQEGLFGSCFEGLQLYPARRQLHGASGNPLTVIGMVQLQMTVKGRKSSEEVYIIRTLKSPLLGKPAIENLNVLGEFAAMIGKIAKANPNPEHPSLFEGLGTLKRKYNVKLKPDVKPLR